MEIAELLAGMRKVEGEIQAGVSAVRTPEIARDPVRLLWNHGAAINAHTVPEAIELEVSDARRKAVAKFSREQLEDSASELDRPDVRAIVRQVVERFTGQ